MKFLLLLLATTITASTKAQDALCYTEQRYCEKGYLGKLSDTNLFYEVWNIPVADGPGYAAIVLRTDTGTFPDSLDFCLDVTRRSDTLFVSDSRVDSTADYAVHKPLQVPTVFQVLTVKHGYQRLVNFNAKGSNATIQLIESTVTLVYPEGPRLGQSQMVEETYRLTGDRFKLFDTKRTPY